MVNVIFMLLMPVSQAISWWLVLNRPLFGSVWKIALFYCVWALYNRFFRGRTMELGQFSFGALAIAAYFRKRNYAIVGDILVILNFLLAFYLCVSMSTEELAKTIQESTSVLAITWAWIFKAYVLSNLILWGLVLRLLIQLPPDGYSLINNS